MSKYRPLLLLFLLNLFKVVQFERKNFVAPEFSQLSACWHSNAIMHLLSTFHLLTFVLPVQIFLPNSRSPVF